MKKSARDRRFTEDGEVEGKPRHSRSPQEDSSSPGSPRPLSHREREKEDPGQGWLVF